MYSLTPSFVADIFEATLDIKWLRWATDLQRTHDALFYDAEAGGVFSSAEGDASVLVRMKEEHDGAEPSNQSVAVMNWLRLASILFLLPAPLPSASLRLPPPPSSSLLLSPPLSSSILLYHNPIRVCWC